MVTPRLTHFTNPAPKSLVSHGPDLWLEDCLAGDSDHLVLVDGRDAPVRVLCLRHLVAVAAGKVSAVQAASASTIAAPAEQADSSYPPLAAGTVMGLISERLAVEVAIQMVASAPETCWVVVDQQQRYLGLLDKARLLALVLTPSLTAAAPLASLPSSADSPVVGDTSPSSRQSLQQVNTALLTYLGHELKTPLTSLLGLSSLLGTERIGPINARQARYVSLIQQHCRRLTAWVNTLIDLGRIDSGSLRLIPRMVDLTTLWQEAYRHAALRVGHEASMVPALPELLLSDPDAIKLVADPSRLQQMLICLMQSALTNSSGAAAEAPRLPIRVEVWSNWIAFISQELAADLHLDTLSQSTFARPFPMTPAATPISGEGGHWLEWLLVRKLAQLHGGELVLTDHPQDGICPVLMLPMMSMGATSTAAIQFVLLLSPARTETIGQLQRQVNQLNSRLLITHQTRDAVEIASHIDVFAVVVLVESPQAIEALAYLREHLAETDCQTVALVLPEWSYRLGSLPADRELLWPTEHLEAIWRAASRPSPPPRSLTLLYLRAAAVSDTAEPIRPEFLELGLESLFHHFGCRVLEIDDLEQASLLCRVWHPDVAVLDPQVDHPEDYLQTLGRFPELTSLPLVTLTMATTEAAQQQPPLTVFPCPIGDTLWNAPGDRDRMAAWLIQTLQAAAASHG